MLEDAVAALVANRHLLMHISLGHNAKTESDSADRSSARASDRASDQTSDPTNDRTNDRAIMR